jgi:hypothetical protein
VGVPEAEAAGGGQFNYTCPGTGELSGILMVEVWFALRDGRKICPSRITEQEAEQQLLLHHLKWSLPEQPPPKFYPRDAR